MQRLPVTEIRFSEAEQAIIEDCRSRVTVLESLALPGKNVQIIIGKLAIVMDEIIEIGETYKLERDRYVERINYLQEELNKSQGASTVEVA